MNNFFKKGAVGLLTFFITFLTLAGFVPNAATTTDVLNASNNIVIQLNNSVSTLAPTNSSAVITASKFNGPLNGNASTATLATNLQGTIPASQVVGALTNNQSGLNLSGSFTGNGYGLTNLTLTSSNWVNTGSTYPTNVQAISIIAGDPGLQGLYVLVAPSVLTNLYTQLFSGATIAFKQQNGTNWILSNPYGPPYDTTYWIITSTTNTSGSAYNNSTFWQVGFQTYNPCNPCWVGQPGQPAWIPNPSGNQPLLTGTTPPILVYSVLTNSIVAPSASFGNTYTGSSVIQKATLLNGPGVVQDAINNGPTGVGHPLELDLMGGTNLPVQGQSVWGALRRPCFDFFMTPWVYNTPGTTETGIVQEVQAVMSLPAYQHFTNNGFVPLLEMQQGGMYRRSSSGYVSWCTNGYPSGPAFLPAFCASNGITPLYDFYFNTFAHIPTGASGVCICLSNNNGTIFPYTNVGNVITPSTYTNYVIWSESTMSENLQNDIHYLVTNGWTGLEVADSLTSSYFGVYQEQLQ